jgi:hypothetical protein
MVMAVFMRGFMLGFMRIVRFMAFVAHRGSIPECGKWLIGVPRRCVADVLVDVPL